MKNIMTKIIKILQQGKNNFYTTYDRLLDVLADKTIQLFDTTLSGGMQYE
jgi:hypothetical protein